MLHGGITLALLTADHVDLGLVLCKDMTDPEASAVASPEVMTLPAS